jgi:uncharacterized lipoprotein YmbA
MSVAKRACRAVAVAVAVAVAGVLAGCAGQPDHFYALNTMPEAARPPAAAFRIHVLLSISIPSVVDRRQLIVDESADQIQVLEHERWAAPLADLVSQTLARDIEQRRPDVLVADRSFDQAGITQVRIQVDIVRLSAHRGGRATLESRWRIVDAAARSDLIGGETLTAPIEGEDYAAIARAYSSCLAALADRLVEKLPSP